MPMPIDLLITYKNGNKEMHYIPMNLMYGTKPADEKQPHTPRRMEVGKPDYSLYIDGNVADIKEIELDPSKKWLM